MFTIRSRRDLSLLLERQMTAASTRAGGPAIDEDIEARTALKTFLLEAHGRMRSDPYGALQELCGPLGITVERTDDAHLVALWLGEEVQLWLDTSGTRIHRLYTVGTAKDADRVHEMLVSGSGLLECVWLPPRALETLAKSHEAKMVLFSLRHDRRPLRRTPDPEGIDSVTLRFWGPRAKETLDKLRHSDVLPMATSVYSVRVRLGDDERYCLAEVFHTGKITAIGTSFAEHERLVQALLTEHDTLVTALETAQKTPRRVMIPVRWTLDDLAYGVGRMFSGTDPFRLWGIPEQTGPESFQIRAVDLDVGRAALFTVDREGLSLELGSRTPASTAIRVVSALQYHVNADVRDDLIAPEPLLQLALPVAAERGNFWETSKLHDVARVVLTEACACLTRGAQSLTTGMLLESTHGNEQATPALHDLTRRVMSEAAAHEWRTWLRIVSHPEGRTAWRFADALPTERNLRLRELQKMNRAAQQLVARMEGKGLAKWLQLSLFGPEEMVTPIVDE
jgi:hypothetical protein